MKDLFGQALLDYYHNTFRGPLLLHNEYGEPEVIPISSYFRDVDEYTDLEIFALENVKGEILDVGAATGRHALYLQKQNLDITAMDISALCGILMKEQGVRKVVIKDVMEFEEEFDTVIMLMNGIGIAGNPEGLNDLLHHLKRIVKPDGQILLDSSDISYLYEETDLPTDKYFGQLTFHYEYNGEIDAPFEWLYIDQLRLSEIAEECGWNCQVIFEDETDAYLARLIHI